MYDHFSSDGGDMQYRRHKRNNITAKIDKLIGTIKGDVDIFSPSTEHTLILNEVKKLKEELQLWQ